MIKKIIDFIREYGYAFYIGGILGFVDISFLDYKWWIIVVPTIILIEIRK